MFRSWTVPPSAPELWVASFFDMGSAFDHQEISAFREEMNC